MQQSGPRTKAREFAFKFLYQFQLPELRDSIKKNSPDILKEKLSDFQKSYSEKDSEHPDNFLNSEAQKFANELIQETLNNWPSLMEWVASKTKGWKLENMDKVDLAILLICASEIKFIKDTPSPVIINEGILLAKKFGAQSSPGFINGVLDALARD